MLLNTKYGLEYFAGFDAFSQGLFGSFYLFFYYGYLVILVLGGIQKNQQNLRSQQQFQFMFLHSF